MSAYTTTVPAIKTEHGAMVDRLGYAYCLDCRPFDKSQWDRIGNLCNANCDGCGRGLKDCTPLEISGTATVEYPGCKIF